LKNPRVFDRHGGALFALAAVLWGVVGMLVGVIIAAQLTWPELNLGIPWLSYGRLRPCTPTR
jgi:cytochrome c oxidase cbb3-type subunit I